MPRDRVPKIWMFLLMTLQNLDAPINCSIPVSCDALLRPLDEHLGKLGSLNDQVANLRPAVLQTALILRVAAGGISPRVCTQRTGLQVSPFPTAAWLFVSVEKTFTASNASLREFEAPLGKSYQCRNRSLDLTEDFHLSALSEQIQAFELKDGKFGEAEVCPEQRRSVVLPIVVGVILGLLILIVLVAFAVGRWRAHTGYESL